MSGEGQGFIHSTAEVQSAQIGARTRIWQFVVILPGAQIGEDCNICAHCFVENDVVVGNRVTVKCGVQLWDGLVIEDDVFIGPNATFTNDRFPRSRHRLADYPRTVIQQGASIGANATILPGVVIGVGAMVGAGSVVTRDVNAHTVVVGNPARYVRNVEASPGA
jgi:acetyltransferase-like isoleucine patch superfamily enzyme